MRVLMILPALTEAVSPFFRPIKYSLFPPLGLASLASHFDPGRDDIEIIDEHTMSPVRTEGGFEPRPDLVVIQTYITNAKRSYRIADYFRSQGVRVALGGLHATSLPEEAALHTDHLFLGPGDATFPEFISDLRHGHPRLVYDSRAKPRTLAGLPPVRRDLIKRDLYLVPNSIVVTRGCPHHCNFCYKDAFFEGGRGSYTQPVDDALAELERLPGKHLYFLDDHLLGHQRFATALFDGMRGMGRLFQGASTVDAILRGNLIEQAVEAGLRSIFVGFESIRDEGLQGSNKRQNLGRDYREAVRRLDSLGVMVNGSFVFGLDGDDARVFDQTVDWAIDCGITTATFHIATPYPGTAFYKQIERAGRLRTTNWDLFDTRHAVFEHPSLSADELESGYWRSYRRFYSMGSIARGSLRHCSALQGLKHFGYAVGWKRLEPAWNLLIRARQLHAGRRGLERWLDLGGQPPATAGLSSQAPETVPLSMSARRHA
ncbi:MAG: radical SAM protein [Planctomycetota bacterium]